VRGIASIELVWKTEVVVAASVGYSALSTCTIFRRHWYHVRRTGTTW